MTDLDLLVAGVIETIDLQLNEDQLDDGRQSFGAGASDNVLAIADTQIPGVVANLIESNPNIDGVIG